MKYVYNLAWLFLLVSWGAQAQTFDLSLISTYPEDGAVNIPEQVTLSLAFDAPLDTTAYYDVSEFFLAAQSFPDIVDPEIMLSPDLTTVEFLVQLDPDTRYTVFITGARSETGSGLDRPYILTFTTGSELPPGAMSGNVDIPTASGDSPKNYGLVALFPFDPSSPGFFQDDLDPMGMGVAELSGDYRVSHLPAGDYIIVGANDENEDGEIDPMGGDGFRFYDVNGDGLADPVTIGDTELGGIDFSILVPLPASARTRYDGALPLAAGIETDAELVALLGEVDPAGESAVWIFVFYAPGAARHLGILCFGDQFSIEGAPVDGFDPITPLPEAWLDSDDAIGVANDNGGSQFILAYPDAEIAAAAGTFTLNLGKNERSTGRPLSLPFGRALDFKGRLSSLPDGTPIWLFVYYSAMGQTAFEATVHAVTGVFDPPPAFFTAASQNAEAALAAAQTWQGDASLVRLMSGTFGIHRSGTSESWYYTYFSPSADGGQGAARTFQLSQNQVVEAFDEFPGNLPSLNPLPNIWVDSPSAAATAEAASDNFRARHLDAFVNAMLSGGIYAPEPDRTVWQFGYSSIEELLVFWIDAETGAIIVANEEEQPIPLQPARLDQNYPNPFGSETAISYKIAEEGPVRLAVYDLLGREVQVLHEGPQFPGWHEIRWTGIDAAGNRLPDGIYLYRLEAAGTIRTRMLVLLR